MSATWNQISVCPGDRFILCSDGLSSVISEESLCRILETQANAEQTIRILADAVKNAGAPDNFTIICVDIVHELPPKIEVSREDQEESDYLYRIAERRKDYGR